MCSISANLGPAHGSYAEPVPLGKGDYFTAALPHRISLRHFHPLTSVTFGATSFQRKEANHKRRSRSWNHNDTAPKT